MGRLFGSLTKRYLGQELAALKRVAEAQR